MPASAHHLHACHIRRVLIPRDDRRLLPGSGIILALIIGGALDLGLLLAWLTMRG